MQEALYAETLSYVAARFDSLLASFGEPPGEADAVWIMEDFRWGDPIFVLVSRARDRPVLYHQPISREDASRRMAQILCDAFRNGGRIPPVWCCNTVPKKVVQDAAATLGITLADALCCRVDSALENLQRLHAAHSWIPGPDHIRPSPAVRAQKELLLLNLQSMWASDADWVFFHVFGMSTKRGKDGKRLATRPEPGVTVFARNPYPYDVPRGTEHWVFWMASPPAEWPDERINAGVASAIEERGGGVYIWYPNPRMSVPDPHMLHVQVFWRPETPAAILLSDAEFKQALGCTRKSFAAMKPWRRHQLLLTGGLAEAEASSSSRDDESSDEPPAPRLITGASARNLRSSGERGSGHAPLAEWQCRACTLLNPVTVRHCAVCGTVRA